MTNTRKIMIQAWTTARSAAAKFGGSAKSFIAEALRMAWRGIDRKTIVRALDRAAARADEIGARPASSRQTWYLAGLLEAAGLDAADIGFGYGHTHAVLTSKRASDLISAYAA